MKQIKKNNKINVGDWLVTPSIFVGNPYNSKAELQQIFTIMKVKSIDNVKGNKRYKQDIHVKSWEVVGDRVLDSAIPTEIGTIYRLDEGELMNIKKQIILMGLEDEI